MFKRFLISLAAAAMLATPAMATDEPFVASITIYTPIVITETSPLSFGAIVGSGVPQTVVVAPIDPGAATFDLAGEPNMAITATIVEASLPITVGATTITIDTFTFGGSLTPGAGSGTGTLDATGALAGTAVGATANIPANPDPGLYSGTLNYRVVYQ